MVLYGDYWNSWSVEMKICEDYEVVIKGVKEEFMNWFYELFFYEVDFVFLKGYIRLN